MCLGPEISWTTSWWEKVLLSATVELAHIPKCLICHISTPCLVWKSWQWLRCCRRVGCNCNHPSAPLIFMIHSQASVPCCYALPAFHWGICLFLLYIGFIARQRYQMNDSQSKFHKKTALLCCSCINLTNRSAYYVNKLFVNVNKIKDNQITQRCELRDYSRCQVNTLLCGAVILLWFVGLFGNCVWALGSWEIWNISKGTVQMSWAPCPVDHWNAVKTKTWHLCWFTWLVSILAEISALAQKVLENFSTLSCPCEWQPCCISHFVRNL